MSDAQLDKRRNPGMDLCDPIRISWEDCRGETKYANTRCVDISTDCLSVEMIEPLPVRSAVILRAAGAGTVKIIGRAIVRYCLRRGTKFLVGLEFAGGLDLANAATTNA